MYWADGGLARRLGAVGLLVLGAFLLLVVAWPG